MNKTVDDKFPPAGVSQSKSFKCPECAQWFKRSSYQPRKYPVGAETVEICHWCYSEATKTLRDDEVVA